VEPPDGGGHFEECCSTRVTIADADRTERATALHARAHDLCFVANSVNFDVRTDPTITVASAPSETPRRA